MTGKIIVIFHSCSFLVFQAHYSRSEGHYSALERTTVLMLYCYKRCLNEVQYCGSSHLTMVKANFGSKVFRSFLLQLQGFHHCFQQEGNRFSQPGE